MTREELDGPTPEVEGAASPSEGVWRVRSEGTTVYWVDLDAWRLLRVPGEGSTTGPYDGVWVPLVSVERLAVGERPRYLTDPDGGVRDYRWWIQRRVTSLEPVDRESLPDGGAS